MMTITMIRDIKLRQSAYISYRGRQEINKNTKLVD